MMRHFILFSILISGFTHTAPLYQWVDENGVTHFSERPPENQPDMQAVNYSPAPSISGTVGDEISESTDTSQASDQSETTTQSNIQASTGKDAELCKQAQDTIATFNNSTRIRVTDPNTGELRYLNEEEKAIQLERWQNQASLSC